MRKIFLTAFVFVACVQSEKKKEVLFSPIKIDDYTWDFYEGRWLSDKAVFRLELALENGAVGSDAHYVLSEFLESDIRASSTRSQDVYSSYSGTSLGEFKIRLRNLTEWPFSGHLRYTDNDGDESMFFITKGNDELIPCDDSFKPLTTDWHHTLHRRSKLSTVEGYFSFEQDSAKFYERNVMQRWKLAELGEYEILKKKYTELAKEKFEGIYLKALAYTVRVNGAEQLVIKRMIVVGKDPD